MPPSPEQTEQDLQKMSQNLLSLLKPSSNDKSPKAKEKSDKRDSRKQSITSLGDSKSKKNRSVWNWTNYHLSYIKSLTFDEFKTIMLNVKNTFLFQG